MKLFKYNQFLGENPLNENLDKAKKFLKDTYLLKTAATDLGFVEGDIDELAEIALKDFFITQAPKPWSKQEVVDAFMSALKLESRVA